MLYICDCLLKLSFIRALLLPQRLRAGTVCNTYKANQINSSLVRNQTGINSNLMKHYLCAIEPCSHTDPQTDTHTHTHAVMFPRSGRSVDAALCSESSDSECTSQEVCAEVESSSASCLEWLTVGMLLLLQPQERATRVK